MEGKTMKYLKITNINTSIGEIDYKGLDISKFVGGSQVYTDDFNTVLVATKEENVIINEDVTELTEAEYTTERDLIRSTIKQQEKTTEQKLEETQERLSQAEADNLVTLEALAEVYEMMLAMQV